MSINNDFMKVVLEKLENTSKSESDSSINREDFKDTTISELKKLLDKIKNTKINILVIGGTGVGKSSTIDALFKSYDLVVDVPIGDTEGKPKTMDTITYELDNLVIWDTPGFGDSTKNDLAHKDKIIRVLNKKDANGDLVIDLVLLIIDNSSRDLGSAYDLFKNVVLPELGNQADGRVLIGLNKSDQVLPAEMFWDSESNKPTPRLEKELEDRAKTIRERVKAETDLDIEPITYCAGWMFEGKVLRNPYNLQKLLSHILDKLPKKKRISLAGNVNEDKDNFKSNDSKEDYGKKVNDSLWASLWENAKEAGSAAANFIKDIVTDPKVVTAAVTALFGAAVKLFKK